VDVVILHVLRREDAGDHGQVRWCAPALSPEERVVVWEGFAPAPAGEHEAVAPVVLEGEIDGRRAYAERIPAGIRMSDAMPPEELQPYVASRVLEGLAALHSGRHSHGAVGADRVVLGREGEVVLIGRGRRGGMAGLDLVAAVSMMPSHAEETLPGETAALAASELARRVAPGDRERLAAWVRAHERPTPAEADPIVMNVTPSSDDGADEVVPDLGPDSSGHDGILDRWGVTTSSGRSGTESTPEVTAEGGGSAAQRLARELWTGLADLPQGPSDRFSGAAGPSRALRTLLAEESPDVLPVPLVSSPLPNFVARPVEVEDQPTFGGGPTDSVTLSLDDMPEEVRRAAASTPGAPVRHTAPRERRAWVEIGLAMLLGGAIVWLLLQGLG
jgi:hypothetical protein